MVVYRKDFDRIHFTYIVSLDIINYFITPHPNAVPFGVFVLTRAATEKRAGPHASRVTMQMQEGFQGTVGCLMRLPLVLLSATHLATGLSNITCPLHYAHNTS